MCAKPFMIKVVLFVAVVAAGRGLSAEPIADMLEKAIYTEETKGDLPAAIDLYKQILSESKSARSAAANAQFRMANCYLKLGKQSEAIAAFRGVIESFPEEQSLVAKAKEHVPADVELLPSPWVDGELTEMSMRLSSGLSIGRQFTSINADERDGRRIWRIRNHSYVTLNGTSGVSRVDVDATTMTPLSSRWRHSLLGDVTSMFAPDRVTYKFSNQEAAKTLAIDKPVYDNEESIHVMRRLPLAVGYHATLPIFSGLGAGLTPVEIKVTGRETIEVPAGRFDCFRVELSVKQTFFYSADEHRYLVKFEAGGVSAETVRIGELKPGARQHFVNEAAGVEFTGSPDWLFFTAEEEGETMVYLLDPAGAAIARIQLIPPAKIEPNDSINQWLEADIERGRRIAKDLALRPEPGITPTIGGHPATGFVADFSDERIPKVKYNLYTRGTKHGLKMTAVVHSAEFDDVRRDLDELVATIQLQ